jgi:uncharacterized phage protein (predicted DNA packaging)
MIVNLEEAKQHLRVEFDDDDSYIEMLISAAEEVIYNSTGKRFTEKTKLAKIAVLLLISELYENRGLVVGKVNEKFSDVVNMILIQLSVCSPEEVI